jgi:hypothetical protein
MVRDLAAKLRNGWTLSEKPPFKRVYCQTHHKALLSPEVLRDSMSEPASIFGVVCGGCCENVEPPSIQ